MSDDWQVVEEALAPNKHKLGYPQALAALARLREREAQLVRDWKAMEAACRDLRESADRADARAEKAEREWKRENEELTLALNAEHEKLWKAERVVEAARTVDAEHEAGLSAAIGSADVLHAALATYDAKEGEK